MGASLLHWAGRGGEHRCPVRADSEAILATEKTEAKRRGWSGQHPGEKDKVRGRDLPQRQAGRGLLSTRHHTETVTPAGTFGLHTDVLPEALVNPEVLEGTEGTEGQLRGSGKPGGGLGNGRERLVALG